MIRTNATVTATCQRCNHSETFPAKPNDYWGVEAVEKEGWDYHHNLCPKCIEEIPAVYACWYYNYKGRKDRLVGIFKTEELAKKYCAHSEYCRYEKMRLYDYQYWEG